MGSWRYLVPLRIPSAYYNVTEESIILPSTPSSSSRIMLRLKKRSDELYEDFLMEFFQNFSLSLCKSTDLLSSPFISLLNTLPSRPLTLYYIPCSFLTQTGPKTIADFTGAPVIPWPCVLLPKLQEPRPRELALAVLFFGIARRLRAHSLNPPSAPGVGGAGTSFGMPFEDLLSSLSIPLCFVRIAIFPGAHDTPGHARTYSLGSPLHHDDGSLARTPLLKSETSSESELSLNASNLLQSPCIAPLPGAEVNTEPAERPLFSCKPVTGFASLLFIFLCVVGLTVWQKGQRGPTLERISIRSSVTKAAWLNTVVDLFNARGFRLANGKTAFVESVSFSYSRFDIGDTPTIYSPGSIFWVTQVNNEFLESDGTFIIGDFEGGIELEPGNPLNNCRATSQTPMGFAMWRSMAEALGWPDAEIRWRDVMGLACAADGWAALGHPEWGQFRFAKSNPQVGNSGYYSILLASYCATDEDDDDALAKLTREFLFSNASRATIECVEQAVSLVTRDNISGHRLLAQNGPGFLHAALTYESDVILLNMYNSSLTDPHDDELVFVGLSDVSLMLTNPFCVLNGPGATWVSDDMVEAATLFIDFATSSAQTEALTQYGLRPYNSTKRVSEFGFPFTEALGVNTAYEIDAAAAFEFREPIETADVLELWAALRRGTTYDVAIDSSGSLSGQMWNYEKYGLKEFLSNLGDHDLVYIRSFAEPDAYILSGSPTEVAAAFGDAMALVHHGGMTDLNSVIYNAYENLRTLSVAASQTGASSRFYSAIVVTDAEDTCQATDIDAVLGLVSDACDCPTPPRLHMLFYGNESDAAPYESIVAKTNGHSIFIDSGPLGAAFQALFLEL
eukprot:gnl/Chilomastix_cuspidata/3309.p1 GENE.gnl/Chilomastix_cuspidata/3309~~gnl/Chilomastix_cuspidata/3309.p1  ORF type:complete len:862 (-),score=255.26 gnl/Chilomastix_cuspidata/3309:104-2647(-)